MWEQRCALVTCACVFVGLFTKEQTEGVNKKYQELTLPLDHARKTGSEPLYLTPHLTLPVKAKTRDSQMARGLRCRI